jgi:hypothetical protein
LIRIDSLIEQVAADGFGPALRELQVVFRRAGAVGMSLELDLQARMFLQPSRDCLERRVRAKKNPTSGQDAGLQFGQLTSEAGRCCGLARSC